MWICLKSHSWSNMQLQPPVRSIFPISPPGCEDHRLRTPHLSLGGCSWAACCCGRAGTSRRPSPRTTRWWCATPSGPAASGCWASARCHLCTIWQAPSGLPGHMTFPGRPPCPEHSPPGRLSHWTQSLHTRRGHREFCMVTWFNLCVGNLRTSGWL